MMMEPGKPGRAIRRERERRGCSVRELARRADLSNSYLSRLESGEIQSPGVDQVEKIARTLDLAPDELMGQSRAIPTPTGPAVAETLGWAIVRAIRQLPPDVRRAFVELVQEGETAEPFKPSFVDLAHRDLVRAAQRVSEEQLELLEEVARARRAAQAAEGTSGGIGVEGGPGWAS